MRARAGLALIAAASLAGCGSGQSMQANRVVDYIRQVDRLERQLSSPLRAVGEAASEFASEHAAGFSPGSFLNLAHERALTRAWTQITAVGAGLRGLPAPAPATRLRGLLVQLVSRQAALTREVLELVEFLPGFGFDLQPLQPAMVSLEQELARSQSSDPATIHALYERKAGALLRFSNTLQRMIAALGRLHPPPVSRPNYESQLRALEGMAHSARKLAAALRSGAAADVPRLLAAFDAAAVEPRSVGAQRAEISAARAYDRQVKELGTLAAGAQRERTRLAARF